MSTQFTLSTINTAGKTQMANQDKHVAIIATHTIPGVVRRRLYKTTVNRSDDPRQEVLRLLGGRFSAQRHDVLCIDRVSSALYNAIDAEWIRD